MTDIPLPPPGSTNWFAWAQEQEQASDASGLRPAGTVAYLGDSITAINAPVISGVQQWNDMRGFATWANYLLGQRFTNIYAGVPGENLTQIAVRAAAVIAQRPTFLHVLGGTNDIGGTLSTTQAAMTSILDAAAAAGIPTIVGTIPPLANSDGTQAPLASRRWIEQFNRWIKGLPASRNSVYVIDYHGLLAASDGGWRISTQYATTVDWVHPSSSGGGMMGRALADFLAPFVPPMDILPTTNVDTVSSGTVPQQMLANPMMVGTGGTKPVGTAVADNCVVITTGAALDATTGLTKVARTDGKAGEWQQITNPVTQPLRMYQDLAVLPPTGNLVSAAIELQTDANWLIGNGLFLHLAALDGNNGYATRLDLDGFYIAPQERANWQYSQRPVSVVIRTPEAPMPASSTQLTVFVDHFGSGTIRIGRMAVWHRAP